MTNTKRKQIKYAQRKIKKQKTKKTTKDDDDEEILLRS